MLEWREECPERSKCRIVVNVEIDDQIKFKSAYSLYITMNQHYQHDDLNAMQHLFLFLC